MAMISPKHFIWIITDKDRSHEGKMLSTAEKAKQFSQMNIGAGTWKPIGDNRFEVTFTHNTNPNLVGNSFQWELGSINGNLVEYYVLKEDGTRNPASHSQKIAGWNAKGSCSKYNGSWVYEGTNGIYMQSGNYGGWIILNDQPKNLTSETEKANAFDAINASFVIGDCNQEDEDFWHIIHSGNPSNEYTTLTSRIADVKDESYTWNLVNTKSQPTDNFFKTKRIEP